MASNATRVVVFVYGVIAYLIFLATFLGSTRITVGLFGESLTRIQ